MTTLTDESEYAEQVRALTETCYLVLCQSCRKDLKDALPSFE